MTVHSPPSTSLGTRRSDDNMGLDLLEIIKSLERFWWFTAPQARVLGQGEVFEFLNAFSFGRCRPNLEKPPRVILRFLYRPPWSIYSNCFYRLITHSPPSTSLGTRRSGLYRCDEFTFLWRLLIKFASVLFAEFVFGDLHKRFYYF